MSYDNINYFCNDIKYIINISFNSMFKKINKNPNYVKFLYNINNQLENEKNINNHLTEQLKNDKIIINDLKFKLERNIICSICLDKELSICCIPCGHTYCNECINNAKNCFICKSNIAQTIKIYIKV